MNTIYRIAKSELSQFFFSPIAWLILIIFAVQTGMIFSNMFDGQLRSQALGYGLYGVTNEVYLGYTGVFIKMVKDLYLYIPLLTMGLMSRELSSGSIKLLYSSPVTNTQIILGKYFSMMAYGVILIAIWMIYVTFGICTIHQMDVPLVLTSMLGLYLLICAYSAIGLFMSCLTSYQVVAAMGTLAVLAFLNFVGEMGQGINFVRDITYWLSISGRVYTFLEGMICSEDLIYFVIVVVLFLSLSVLKLESERKKRTLLQTTGRYCFVIIIALGLGYISSLPKMKLYADVTATKSNTLTPNSQAIMKQLDGDLKITTYVNLLSESYYDGLPENVKHDFKRFEQYVRFKPEIKMEYVYYYDTAENESLQERYPLLNDKEKAEKLCRVDNLNFKMFLTPEEIKKVIDLSSEENRFVRIMERENGQKAFLRIFDDMEKHPSETEISAALKRFLVKSPKVGFLTGHNERDIESTGDRYYNTFAKKVYFRHSLINQGFDVIPLSLASSEVPADVDIIVIADMRSALTPEEAERLNNYIARGGNLFILGEPNRQEFMNPIVAPLGVEFMAGNLVQDNKEDYQPTLIVGNISEAGGEKFPAFNKIRNYGYGFAFPSAVGLNYTTDKGFDVCTVAATRSKGSWNELGRIESEDTKVELNPEAGEVEQSYPTVLALTRMVGEKEQRILIIGDADCISNGELSKQRNGIHTSNFPLITGTFKWFSYGEYPIDTSRPDLRDNSISMSRKAMPWIKAFSLGILPFVILFLGIYTRRKRKGR